MPNLSDISRSKHLWVEVDEVSAVHACFIAAPSDTEESITIFSHGFGTEGTESRRFLGLAEALAEDGYSSLLFDYRGAGYSDWPFDRMTFATEVADLQAVIDYARETWPERRVVLWAASFGCAVAANVAADREDIAFMVFWGLSADLHARYTERLGPEIFDAGYTYTDRGFKVARTFVDSLEGIDTFSDIERSNVPVLLVHGDEDQTAPTDLSRRAAKQAPLATLHEVAGGNHGFKSQPLQTEEATRVSKAWFVRQLRGNK